MNAILVSFLLVVPVFKTAHKIQLEQLREYAFIVPKIHNGMLHLRDVFAFQAML